MCRFLINNVSNLSNVAKVNGLAFTLRGNPFLHVGGAKKSWNLREFHAFGVFQRSIVRLAAFMSCPYEGKRRQWSIH